MLSKAPKEIKESIGLTKWQDYAMLNQKNTVAEVTTWNDEQEFADCHAALNKLGFSDESRSELYSMLALCLNLGNLSFKAGALSS
jgi:myosin heavy subunit